MGKANHNLVPTIDRLGNIKAQLAALKIEEAELKAVLVEQGPGPYEGDVWRATISLVDRETQDDTFKAWVAELIERHVSRQFKTAHTIKSQVPTLRVVARTGKVRVAA
jgi:hypothetical protein